MDAFLQFSRVYGCKAGYPTSSNDSKDPLQGIHSRKLSKKSVKGTCPRNPSKDPAHRPGPIENVHFLTLEGWHDSKDPLQGT